MIKILRKKEMMKTTFKTNEGSFNNSRIAIRAIKVQRKNQLLQGNISISIKSSTKFMINNQPNYQKDI